MGMRNDSCMTYLYAVVSRQPGGGRCCSSGMSHGFSKEASRCRIETGSDVALQDPLRGMLSGQPIEALFDRIRGGALCPEAIRVWVAARFRNGIEREEVQRLHRTIVPRRDRQRTLATRAICLRNGDAPKRQGAIATLPECLDGARFLCRGVPPHIVDPWGLAAIVGRHSFDG